MADAKSYHDVGSNEQAFRSGVRNKGGRPEPVGDPAGAAPPPAVFQARDFPPWVRCSRRGCDGWTRGKFCPRHAVGAGR